MKRIVFFLYQLFVWLPIFVSITILTAVVVIIGCGLGGKRFFSYYPGMIWSKLVCFITLCPVKVVGREKLDKNRSYIFTANHQGAFDIFLVYGFLGQPIKWVMKQSLRKIPFVGKACELAGFIFVDNSSPQAAAKTIIDAERELRGGSSIVIFPEGSRSRTGKMASFKKGAYAMAMDLNLPIVPVTLNGPFEVMPIGSILTRPHKLELIIHDPISTEGMKSDDLRETAGNIRLLMNKSKASIESGLWERYK